MKSPSFLRVVTIVIAVSAHVHGQQPPTNTPWATPAPGKDSKWNIRAEGLAVVMPQEKALAWMPEMLDESKVDGVAARIIEGIQREEITLTGYPIVLTSDGVTGTSETTTELVYPSQYEPPTVPTGAGSTPTPSATPNPAANPAGDTLAIPTAFERTNLGLDLQIYDPQVIANGTRISASISFDNVSVLKWTAYQVTKTASGKLVRVEQPIFFKAKSSGSTTISNGHFILLGTHKLEKPKGTMAVYLVRVTAIPRGH